jgi:hypothetical protein
MAVKLGEFHVNAGEVEDLLKDPAGPVGQLIAELSGQVVAVAKQQVHVYPGTPRSTIWNEETSSAVLPRGTTRDSISVHLPRIGSRGGMYGGANVAFLPGMFLEYEPHSVQMYDHYPFLTTGLDSLVV